LEAVRRQEGVSRRTIARRLGIGLREVQAQEQGTADLPLSTLYRWKEVLNVPISELLEEDAGEASSPVVFRGKLLRVMRTAVTILERTRNAATHRLAQFMVEQLIEIMPELKDTTPWPSVGKRRNRRELGRAAQLRLPADMMRDLDMS
jgi:transcriptional regulator with XRE-family HTH domain